MRVCITGGAGFIGSHLVDHFIGEGHDVLVIDDLSTGDGGTVPKAAQFCGEDIRSEKAAATLVAFAPEVLCHHAAQIDVRKSMKDPVTDTDINVVGLVNMVEAARMGGALEHVLFASTGGAIYGDVDKYPIKEDVLPRPESVYGMNKWLGEQMLSFLAAKGGFAFTALRYANVYGPRQRPDTEAGVVAIFCGRLLNKQPLTIYGDGDQTRDFIYVGDIVEANARALEMRVQGSYNVGTGVETNISTLANTLRNKSGTNVAIDYAEARPGEQRRSSIHPGRFSQTAGWAPQVSLAEGLGFTLRALRGS